MGYNHFFDPNRRLRKLIMVDDPFANMTDDYEDDLEFITGFVGRRLQPIVEEMTDDDYDFAPPLRATRHCSPVEWDRPSEGVPPHMAVGSFEASPAEEVDHNSRCERCAHSVKLHRASLGCTHKSGRVCPCTLGPTGVERG